MYSEKSRAQTLQTALGPSKHRELRPQTPPYEGPTTGVYKEPTTTKTNPPTMTLFQAPFNTNPFFARRTTQRLPNGGAPDAEGKLTNMSNMVKQEYKSNH